MQVETHIFDLLFLRGLRLASYLFSYLSLLGLGL
jgi:hypothetical protein